MKIVLLDEPFKWSNRLEAVRLFVRRRLRSRIFDAIERNDEQLALRLATPRRLRRSRGEWDHSPLAAAISKKRSGLACEFIRRGGCFAGDGTLALAAMAGDLQVVRALLAAGKNPDEPASDEEAPHVGYTPLMWATNRRFLPIIEALLSAGANVNARAEDGSTAAMFTLNAEADDLKALEILCRYNPDITLKDWRGRNLIREAMDRESKGGRPEMRKLLQRFFPELDWDAF
jgi:uncharacterized protein